ncbi:MAG: DNA-directed RNA polymerase subunit K [Candidatus Nanoarchaeia archaeon]
MADMKLTKYEKARLVGARALQLAMGAPLLLDLKEEDFERINYNPIEIAKMELEKGILPLAIKRPMPKKAA